MLISKYYRTLQEYFAFTALLASASFLPGGSLSRAAAIDSLGLIVPGSNWLTPISGEFTTQPASQTVATGATASFDVAVSGAIHPTYQWEFSSDSGQAWAPLSDGSGVSGSATAVLTLGKVQRSDAGRYACVVKLFPGAQPLGSNVASLTVAYFTAQPTSQTVPLGCAALFEVGVGGASHAAYQWNFLSTSNNAWFPLSDGDEVSGSSTARLTLLNLQANQAGSYECVVTTSSGARPLVSNVARLAAIEIQAFDPTLSHNDYWISSGVLQSNGALEAVPWATAAKGAAADGVSVLVLRALVPGLIPNRDTVTFSIANAADGTLSNSGDAGSPSTATSVTVLIDPVQSSTQAGAMAVAIYHAPMDYDSANPNDNSFDRPITITATTDTGFTHTFSLGLCRTPIILLHDLWDSYWGGWGNSPLVQTYLGGAAGLGQYYYPADYGRTAGAGFAINKYNFPGWLASALAARRALGFAVAGVDIVAHGLGSEITRAFAQSSWYTAPLRNGPAAGRINRLIAVDTPTSHLGGMPVGALEIAGGGGSAIGDADNSTPVPATRDLAHASWIVKMLNQGHNSPYFRRFPANAGRAPLDGYSIQTVSVGDDRQSLGSEATPFHEDYSIPKNNKMGNTALQAFAVAADGTLIETNAVSLQVNSGVAITEIDSLPAQMLLPSIGHTGTVTLLAVLADGSTAGIATGGGLRFTSSNPSVATIDQTGLVTALAPGTTTVTASYDGFNATCAVLVDPNYGIALPGLETLRTEGCLLGSRCTIGSRAVNIPKGATPVISWSQTGGPAVTLTGATSSHPSFAPSVAGTYEFEGSVRVGTLQSHPAYVTVAVGTSGVAPSFTTEPVNLAVDYGGNAVFTAAASGIPTPAYQWYFNGNAIAGAAGTSCLVSGANASNAGQYTVSVTNASGIATSHFANLTVNPVAPIIAWNTPAAIQYGTPLGETQLHATASIPGRFTYAPAAGAVLRAGARRLSVTFTPTDTADYTATTASVSIMVNRVTPVITWAAPAAVTYGTPLNGSQFNATASAAGTFTYNPAAGTVLNAGTDQTLSVSFAPTDSTDYTSATATTPLTVTKATPTVSWADLSQTYDGTAKIVTAKTDPTNLALLFSCDGVPLVFTPVSGNLAAYAAATGQTLYVNLRGRLDGTVYGSGHYAINSDLATAAVQAGILTPGQTAVVQVQILADQGSYSGSSQNGVTSRAQGASTASFQFAGIATSGFTLGPITAGVYAVTATVVDSNHVGSDTEILIITSAKE